MKIKAQKTPLIVRRMVSSKYIVFLLAMLFLSDCCQGVINLRGFEFKKERGPPAVYEGSQSVYQVLMQEQPANEVTLNLQTEVDGYIRTLTDRLTFNSSNWNETREIVIFGIDDDIIRYSPYGGVLNVTASTNDNSSTLASLTLLVKDTDRAGVIISPKEVYPSYRRVPEGRWGTYEVMLPSIPTQTVFVTFRTLSHHITLSPSFMVFTPDQWNTPQQLLVYAIEDDIDMEYHYESSFSTSIVSNDTNFHEEPVDDFPVSIEDNDEDESVLSGSLTWRRIELPDDPRTKAEFHLSLTLSTNSYPNVNGVDDVINMPGILMYGDDTQADDLELKIVQVNQRDGYFIAEAYLLHEFDTANYFGVPWEAVYEHCCRSSNLQNNKKTKLALSVHVDLNYAASPYVPVLPVVQWVAHKTSEQRMYYTALGPSENPLQFTLGTSIDYRSSQAGSPQGVTISSMTGLLSWDTTHINPGDYSLQVVTQDLVTGLRVAAEVLLQLSNTDLPQSIPGLPFLLEPVNRDILYVNRGSTLNTLVEVTGVDPAHLVPMAISPKPRDLHTYISSSDGKVYLNISWPVPEDYEGTQEIVCQEVTNEAAQVTTPPICLTIMVFVNHSETFTIDFNGKDKPEYHHNVTYEHGLHTYSPVVPDDVFLTTSSDIHYAYIFFATYYDGINETLEVTDFNHPSLKLEHLPLLSSPDAPSVLAITGISLVDAYEEALQHVTYKNTKGRPTVGDRVIVVRTYNGITGNTVTDSYIRLTVEIANVPPVIKVNGNNKLFMNRFYPGNPPVPAISSTQGLVIDEDSSSITKAILTIQNPLDGNNEYLDVFYKTPELLSVPIVQENTEIHKPFGMLFSGELVEQITDTINITTQGKVGDVDVVIDIRHSWIGDLKLELVHAERRVLLVLSPGGRECGKHNLFSTAFDSESSDNVELSVSTTSPGLCQFESQGLFTTEESLQSFNGNPIEGDWVLHITDLLTNEDSGRLVSWGLVIQPQEDHLVISSPAVVPSLTVGHDHTHRQQHQRLVEADGRIVDMAVHVSLGVSFNSDHLHIPTMTLVHPDGTEILLSDGSNPLCAYGNYTHVIFDDRVSNYSDFSCKRLYNETDIIDTESEISGSGSGGSFVSGSGSGDSNIEMESEPDLLNIYDLIDMNVTIPTKLNLIDIIPPSTNFSIFKGKRLNGVWTLVIYSDYLTESHLLGWSVKVKREANIDSSYDSSTGTLTLEGEDSAASYQQVLRTVHYNNPLPFPDFSEPREIISTLYDGDAYSNTSLPSSISQITIHHIIIDLDPLDVSNAPTPNYDIEFMEHGLPIPAVDPENALLVDPAYQNGLYSLVISLSNYGNGLDEGLLVNTSAFPNVNVANETRTDTKNQKYLILNISSDDPQPISNFQSILRSVEYFNDAQEFHGSYREIQFVVQDFSNGNVFTSEAAVTNISLLVYNDPPILILNIPAPELPFIANYSERDGPISIVDDKFLLYDHDDDTLSSITVKITEAYDGEYEVLEVNETVLEDTWIMSNYDNSTNTLILSGIDSIDNYTLVLSTITYDNTKRYPGDPDTTMRVITFVANDGNMDGVPNVTLISFSAVNDPPFVDLNGMSIDGSDSIVVFKEESGPIELSSKAAIFDIDDDNLVSVTVRITNALDNHSELVSVSNGTDVKYSKNKVIYTSYTPEVDYNPDTSILTITGLTSVHAYQQVLKTLTYNNIADEPHPQTRIIEVIAYDGEDYSDPVYSNITIDLINDSPRIDENVLMFTYGINEDRPEFENYGFAVSELSYLIVDDDVDSVPGIAITSTDTSNGVWEYTPSDGEAWSAVNSNVSLTYAFVLSADANSSTRLRFLPDRDFNGNVTLMFVAWDATDDEIDGTYLNAQSTSVIDPFSSTITELTVIVGPINDAPVLLPITINLTTILEDDYTSYGDSVIAFLQYASDVDIDGKDMLGIAVVSAEQQNGVWQYSENGGNSWTEFDNEISYESALLLRGYPVEDNRVRFVPNKDYNGYDEITFLAWDLTYAGLITDTDTPLNKSVEIIISSGSGSGNDLMMGSGSGSGSGAGDFIASGSGDHMNPNANGSDNNVSVSVQETLVLQRYVNVTLSDSITGPLSVNNAKAGIKTEPVNDSPTVVDNMKMESIKEDISNDTNHGTNIKQIINGFYGDVDAHPMKGLAIVEVDDRFGVWQYRCNISEEWKDFIGDKQFGGIYPFLPRPEKATLLLDNCWIRFIPDDHFNTEYDYNHHPRPSSDTPYIIAHGWDNTGLTEGLSGTYGNDATYANTSITNEYSYNTVTVPITVTSDNDVPILWLANGTISKFATTFYEDLESVAAVGEELVLIDNDHARLRNATITIRGEFDQSPYNETELNDFIESVMEDYHDNVTDLQLLQDFVKTAIPEPTQMELYCAGLEERTERLLIDVSYLDLVTEVVSFCPFIIHIYPDPEYEVYDADVAMFQKALRTVRYNNSVQEPLGGERSIEFKVFDDFGHSLKVYTTIDVVLINDAPILDINDYIPDINNFVTYYEGDEPLLLTNHTGLRLVDFDNDYLQHAKVILFEAPDTINETLTADTQGTNIIADYENYTLYLTGNDTVENYAKVLSTVTYYNNYSSPGNPDQRDRIVYFTVSDGEKENLPAQATVNFYGINDRPSIDVNGDAYGTNYTTTFREEEGSIHVTSQFTILVDEDNDTLAYVTAAILNPLDGSLETLSVSSSVLNQLQEKYPLSTINVTFNETISTLTISGLQSVSDYKRLVKTIMYDNGADEFVDIARIIEFIASDGLLISNSAHTTVQMMPINDSPYFNEEPIIVPHIYEDTFEDEGDSVYSIAYDLIEDHDSQYMSITKGIAVVEVDIDHGHWEYNIDDTEWQQIPSNTSLTHSLLLDASESTFIRFVPDKDFNGNVTLAFVAWDGVDGLPEGTQRIAMSVNNTDPFSEDIRVLTVVVVPVNDAPVLNVSNIIVFSNILEDDVLERPSRGEDVSIFFPSLITDVDQDYKTHEFGVAIVEADQSNGRWQVSTDNGTNWKNISSPSAGSAIVLRSSPNGYHRIRFAPLKDFNGETSLSFKLWDLNVTHESGMEGVETNTDVVTGTFSVESGTASLTVDPVNDSPILEDGVTLASENEDSSVSFLAGASVHSILHSHYIDVDLNIDTSTFFDDDSNIGVAVVSVDVRYGLWQYTCDDDNIQWNEFKGGDVYGFVAPRLPIPERGTLLNAACRIRFVPEENFNTEYDLNGDPRPISDRPWLSLRGWDNTGDTEGMNEEIGIDTTSDPDDHTNPFSEHIRQATIVIESVNDVPQVLIDGVSTTYSTVFTEPLTPNRTVIPVAPLDSNNFVIADVDNARIRWVTVTLEVFDDTSEEYLTINTTGTNINVENSTANEGEYRLVLRPSNGTVDEITEFNTALRTLLYVNNAEEPNPAPRNIEFRASDGISVSPLSTTTIYIQLINDPPEIDLNTDLNDTYNIIRYSEGQGPELLVDPTLSLIDFDNTTLDYITVTITNLLDGEAETLIANSTSTNITISYINGTLLLQGPDTIENFQGVLLTVKYNNSLSHPGHPTDDTRIINIIANDGLNDSFAATAFLYFTAINNLPILDLSGTSVEGVGYSTIFTEEQGPVSPLDVERAVLVDVDNETLAFVEVVLTNPLDGAMERLWVDNVTEYKDISDNQYLVSEFNPLQHYNYTTGVLRVTGLDTVYEYQQVLRTLKYNNMADEPRSGDRQLLFTVSDGISARTGVSATIHIDRVNDSPYVNMSALLYNPVMYEDVSDYVNIGWSLEDLTSNWILDDDHDAIMGVAVVAVDTSNGKWEYTLDYHNDSDVSGDDESGSGSSSGSMMEDSSTWYVIPDTTSVYNATVLKVNDNFHRIRFFPDHDFNGEVTITLVAWDATDNLPDGSVTNAESQSHIDAFSYQSVLLTATIEPVNDAPLLNGETVNMTTILEDNPTQGNNVALFISGASDVDRVDLTLGIAVVAVDDQNGSWEFTIDNGNTWEQLTDVSATSATLLSSYPSDVNRIRFVPSQDYNGYATLTFLAWDQTSHGLNGMTEVDTTNADPVTGPFSITSSQASIYVEAINDSPVVSEGMSITIYEDMPVSENTGNTVSDIVQGSYIDVDAKSETGFAVVGVNIDNGLWQYRCPDFDEWKDFIGNMIYGIIVPKLPRPEKATMLSGDCRVRFLPNIYFNTYEDLNGDPRNTSDIPYLAIKGWDNTGITNGLAGKYGIDATHGNESIINELSSDTVKVLVYIESINNPTELNITSDGDGKVLRILFTEDDPYIRIVEPLAVSIIDVDNATLQSVTIELTNAFDSGDEWIDIDPVDSNVDLNDTTEVLYVNVSGKTEIIKLEYHIFNDTEAVVGVSRLTLYSYEDSVEVSKEAYAEAIKHLVYINDHPEPVNETRFIIFHVNDGIDTDSSAQTYIEYKLLAENHPVLVTHLYQFNFTEGDHSPVPLVSSELSLADEDHNEFFHIAQALISIEPVPVSDKERVIVDMSVVPDQYSVSQSYNPVTGKLLVHGDAPVDVYQDILRTTMYDNTMEEPPPGPRTISIVVEDAHGLHSNIEYVTVTVLVVNDRSPVISTAQTPFYYREHRVTSTPTEIPIHEDLTVFDPDSGNLSLEWIEIQLTNPMDGTENEVLTADETIHVMVNYSEGILTLMGPAKVDEFQEVLSTLMYINTAEEPTTLDHRIITVIAYDGLLYSTEENISIIIIMENDPPVVDLNGDYSDINYITEYIEGGPPVPIVNISEFIITDNDNVNLTRVIVRIVDIYDTGKEVLTVGGYSTAAVNATYSLTTGELILEGNAPLETYIDILKTATYSNLESEPGNPNTTMRKISFTVYDQLNSSVPAITYMTFQSTNDPPFLDLNGNEPGDNYTTLFIEEGEAVFLSDENVTLFDIDSEILAQIRVRIVNCLNGSFEQLSLSDTVPDTFVLTSSICELNITGLRSVVAYEDIIRLLTYQNTADEPEDEDRIIEIIVNDNQDDSEPRYTTVSVMEVNDPPRLQIAPPPGVYNYSDFITTYTTDQSNSTKNMTTPPPNIDGSGSGLGTGSGMDIGSGLDIGSGVNDIPTIAPPTDSPTPIDSNTTMNDDNMKVYINSSIYSTLYVENGDAVPIVEPNFVNVEDDDDALLSELEVVITNVLDEGFETVFISQSALDQLPSELSSFKEGVRLAYGHYVSDGCPVQDSPHHASLVIDNTLTIQEMTYIIQTLHYCNTDNDPVEGERNITFRIRDTASDWSSYETSTVTVVPVNDAPIYNDTVSFDDQISVKEDHNVTIPVLHLFYDYEEQLSGNSTTIISIVPNIGTATIDPVTGDIIYYTAPNDYGVRVVSYTLCDSMGACASPVRNLTITVDPINDSPYIIGSPTLVTKEDTPIEVDLTEYFGDIEDDASNNTVSYPQATVKDLSQLSLVSLNIINGSLLQINPRINAVGENVLEFEVCDSNDSCVSLFMKIVILPVNDAPEIDINYKNGEMNFTTNEDTEIVFNVTFYDVESNLTTPIIEGVVDHGNGKVTMTTIQSGIIPSIDDYEEYRRGNLQQIMSVSYTPNLNYYGDDIIVISATDSEGSTVNKSIVISVLYVNDAPHFGITEVTTVEDIPLEIKLPSDLNVTDPEDVLHSGSFKIIEQPSHGSLTYTYNDSMSDEYPSTGTLLYTPSSEYYSTPDLPESFIIQACDHDMVVPDKRLCTNASITVIVVSSNDPPFVPVYTVTISEESVYTDSLIEKIVDVEEGQPLAEKVTILQPFPKNGDVIYNSETGSISYTPNKDFFGFDYIYFESCDMENNCNSSGLITINVLDVNDPPSAMDLTAIVREDIFELIDIHMYSSDLEDAEENLKISIVDSTSGEYVSEGEIALESGAFLRVYQEHGIVTYEPKDNFVGIDIFRYAICDTCDLRRNAELGRTSFDDYPQCTRQLEENGGNRNKDGEEVDITCDEALVRVMVINENDVPESSQLSGKILQNGTLVLNPLGNSRVLFSNTQQYLYSNTTRSIYDIDDKQSIEAQIQGLNLTEFGLSETTDIDESSLSLGKPANGLAFVNTTDDGLPYIVYRPMDDFSGYDSFDYMICDIPQDGKPPRCTNSMIQVFVTKPGPKIISLTAEPMIGGSGYDENSRVSKGDKIMIQFDQATNMPPHREINVEVNAEEIDKIFNFPQGFIPSSLYSERYTGTWTNVDQFEITITNEGYPQPENKIGTWTVGIQEIDEDACGGINSEGGRIIAIDSCLLSSDTYSFHSVSTSPPVQGNWGLRLPEPVTVIVSRNTENQGILTIDSIVSFYLREPFSHNQLVLYCSQEPSDIFEYSTIGTGVSMTVVGCENTLANSDSAFTVYRNQIEQSRQYFEVLDYSDATGRGKRQIDNSITEQPVVSKIELQITSLAELSLNAIDSLANGLNQTTMARVVSQLSGVDASQFITYQNEILPPEAGRSTSTYLEQNSLLTPRIATVSGNDPDCLHTEFGDGDTITIQFQGDTDQPNIATKEDIDKIFVFETPIGLDYEGFWDTPSKAVIRINTVIQGSNGNPDRISFTPNYLDSNTIFNDSVIDFPTNKKHCYGINVCGTGEPTIGVCDPTGSSCRAYEPVLVNNIVYDGGLVCAESPPSTYWIYILIAFVVLIIIVIVLVLICYCYRKNKQRRQKEEAMRVVERWHKSPKSNADSKEGGGTAAPWAKPPDVFTMRDQPDPFSTQTGPLKNLPEMVRRPPTAAAGENLPSLDTIPMPFVPRTGARIVPELPNIQPPSGMLRKDSLPSLTPLGLPRITRQSQASLPPIATATNEVPSLGPLQGPLHMYARQTSGPLSPTSAGPSTSTLPGVLRPNVLPPLQGVGLPGRRISGAQLPQLPNITGTGRPLVNKVTPLTTSDENNTSTSEIDTTEEGTTTSDGGQKPLLRQPTSTSMKPSMRPRPSNLSIGGVPPPLSPATGAPISPPGFLPPSMPLRKPSIDPFARRPSLTSPTSGLPRMPTGPIPLSSPNKQSSLASLPTVGPSLRAPPLPSIPMKPSNEKKEDTT